MYQGNADKRCRCLNSSSGTHLSIISYQIEMFSSGIGSQRSGLCQISGLVILLSLEWALRTSINRIWRTGYTTLTLTTISPWGLQRHISRWLEKCCNQSCSISPPIVHGCQGYWNTLGSRRILLQLVDNEMHLIYQAVLMTRRCIVTGGHLCANNFKTVRRPVRFSAWMVLTRNHLKSAILFDFARIGYLPILIPLPCCVGMAEIARRNENPIQGHVALHMTNIICSIFPYQSCRRRRISISRITTIHLA